MRIGVVILLGVCCAAAGAEPRDRQSLETLITVAVDVQGVADLAYRRLRVLALQRSLTLRLTQAGFAVVGADRPALIRLSLRSAALASSLRLHARTVDGATASREVSRGTGAVDDFHLEAIHKAIALLRGLERELVRRRPRPASRPSTPFQPGDPDEKPPWLDGRAPPRPSARPKVERLSVELSAAAALVYRPPGVDAQVQLGARVGRRRGLGGRIGLSITPSGAESLRVIEWGARAGAGWRFVLARRLDLDLALLAGFSHHVFRSPELDGAELRFVGQGLLALGLVLTSRLRLGLDVLPGFSHARIRHRICATPAGACPADAPVLWERGPFRLELALRLGLVL